MKTASRITLACIALVCMFEVGRGMPTVKQTTYAGPSRPFPFMQEMEQAYRQLRRQIRNSAVNADSLGLVKQLQHGSLAAKDVMPPAISDLSMAEQQKQFTAYKHHMIRLLHAELELETHLLENDNLQAARTLAAIEEIRQQGHRIFRRRKMVLEHSSPSTR